MYKSFDINTEKDVLLLVENAVLEGKNIDYKLELHTDTDCNKKEFLADVCSFANGEGGHLIIGVREKKGVPIGPIDGIEIEDIDKFSQRINNMIRMGIEPHINYELKVITLKNNKYVVSIKIEKGKNGPFRVCYKSKLKFYSRNSSGKYSMDLSELRNAFNLFEHNNQKIEEFKKKSINNLLRGKYPVNSFKHETKVILHFIPANAFNLYFAFGHNEINLIKNNLVPLNHIDESLFYRWDVDGFIASIGEEESESYIKIYKNGIIEIVDGTLLTTFEYSKKKLIPSIYFDKQILNYTEKYYLPILKRLGISTPIFFYATLVNIQGYKMALDRNVHSKTKLKQYPISDQIISLKEILIYDYEDYLPILFKPCFDAIWNACGLEYDMNYTVDGVFKLKLV